MKNQQQVGHNHEVEQHLLDISNFFNKSKTEKLFYSLKGVQKACSQQWGQWDWIGAPLSLSLSLSDWRREVKWCVSSGQQNSPWETPQPEGAPSAPSLSRGISAGPSAASSPDASVEKHSSMSYQALLVKYINSIVKWHRTHREEGLKSCGSPFTCQVYTSDAADE